MQRGKHVGLNRCQYGCKTDPLGQFPTGIDIYVMDRGPAVPHQVITPCPSCGLTSDQADPEVLPLMRDCPTCRRSPEPSEMIQKPTLEGLY